MVPFVSFGFLFAIVVMIAMLILGLAVVTLVVKIIGAVFRVIFGGTRAVFRAGARPYPATQFQPCTQVRCHAMNPSGARFCRRCGAYPTTWVPRSSSATTTATATGRSPTRWASPSGPSAPASPRASGSSAPSWARPPSSFRLRAGWTLTY